MMSKSDFDNFDEDLDDILLSDDETNKKSKKNITVIKKEEDVVKVVKDSTVTNASFDTKVKPKKADLFDDDMDPLSMIDNQSKPPKSSTNASVKTAKSVLESLLSPVSDLELISGGGGESEERWTAANPRPATSNNGRRMVRFSQEALDGDGTSSSRPATAPGTNKEANKTARFVSRFEMEDDAPPPRRTETRFTSESDPSLWRTPMSDDFLSAPASAPKVPHAVEDGDAGSRENRAATAEGGSRPNSKQRLAEFLQAANEDTFTVSAPRSLAARNTSEEELTLTLRSSASEEPQSEWRASVQTDQSPERPRTAHRRSESIDVGYGRRASVQPESVFERPRTHHGRPEAQQVRSEPPRHNRSDVDLQLKHLQSERDDLQYKLDGIVKRSKEELDIVEKSYKNRIELIEENMQRKEKRFREEIDMLSQQNKQKLQMLEDERIQMRAELSRREEDIEGQKRQELSRIRDQHQSELDRLRLKHEDMVERLRHARTEEESTIRLAQPATAQLQSVLTQVSNGAQDLAAIKQQLLDQMKQQIREKDIELNVKGDSLRELEEQLNIQKRENVKERERLQSLISKLDIQLKEQAKQSEEERWYLRQEQNKVSAIQSSLEKEREHILKEKDEIRESHEDYRAKLLEEQKLLFEQVYAEKRSLAEERARLTREVAKWSESSQISNVKKNQESAEFEGIRSALAEERREIEAMRSQAAKEREDAGYKISQMNSLSHDIKLRSEKLSQLEYELEAQRGTIEAKERNSRQLDLSGEEALKKATEMQHSYQDQLSVIQKQLLLLSEKEKQMHKEEIELERQRVSVTKQEKSYVCTKCSNTLRDSAIGGSLNNITSNPTIAKRSINMRSDNRIDQSMEDSIEYSHFISSQLEEERLIHSIRRAADEDRDYLINEQAYLRSLTSDCGRHLRGYVKG